MTAAPASLAEALLLLQGRLPAIAKSKTAKVQTQTGPNYSYQYADLAVITRKLLPILGELGLTWTCRPTLSDGRFVLAYSLAHISGGEIAGEYPLPTTGTPQALGAAISYSRRYCLTAVTGLCPDGDDTDAVEASAQQHASERPEPQRRERAPRDSKRSEPEQQDGPRMISETQSRKLHTVLGKAGHTERVDRLAYCAAVIGHDITSTSGLTFREAAQVISSIENALAEGHEEGPA